MSAERKSDPHANREWVVSVENVTLQELLNIRWGDVGRTLIQLRRRRGAGRASRPVTIPVSDDLRKLLDQIKLNREGG